VVEVDYSYAAILAIPTIKGRWWHLVQSDCPTTIKMRKRFLRWYKDEEGTGPMAFSLYADGAELLLKRLKEKGGTVKFSNWEPIYELRREIPHDPKNEFKINNGFIAYLARVLVALYPKFYPIFHLNCLKGQVRKRLV